MSVKTFVICVLFTMCTITFAYQAVWEVKGNVPFQFTAGKSVLPAGDYEFVPDQKTPILTIRPSGGSVVIVQVLTRLAAPTHSTGTDAHVVFDKVGTTYTLSEIWLPNEDGFLVHATKGKHEHHVVHLRHHK